jgi:hypothetical protein
MWNRVYRVEGADLLNIRETPGINGHPIASLRRGQIVARLDLEERGGWWAVFADTSGLAYVGFVRSRYLVQVAPTSAPSPRAAPPEDGRSPTPPIAARLSERERSWLEHFITPPSSAWRGTVGLGLSPDEFAGYARALKWAAWRPKYVVLHHTWKPNCEMRQHGFTEQHLKNIEHGYLNKKDSKGNPAPWQGGPHLFIDDNRIWVFQPLTVQGTHAKSFNAESIGIEMLGNYQTEDEAALSESHLACARDQWDGHRGVAIRKNAVSAMASVMTALGLPADALRFHRDDPQHSTKPCPGGQVQKEDVIDDIREEMERRSGLSA